MSKSCELLTYDRDYDRTDLLYTLLRREEGVTDPKQAIENISWQSEVTTSGEQFERWSALLASVVCALVNLSC